LYISAKKTLLFQAARQVWAKTLWMNLNPELLLNGTEKFLREFRCFDEAVKRMAVGQVLHSRLEEFRNSVPLFVKLKNDALRDRHWKDLMDKTGLCQSSSLVDVCIQRLPGDMP
jgi:dynein heavy chain